MVFSSRPANELKLRNHDEDYLKAVLGQIVERESVGGSATPYLLSQKADLEARLGLTKPAVAPVLSAVVEPLEHKAEVPAPEHAVPESPESPRRPGRPKRVADDAAAGS